MKRQCIAAAVLIISLLIFYFLILPLLNLHQFIDSLKKTDLIIYSLALLSILLSNVIASIRWSVILKRVNTKHSHRFVNSLGMFCFGQVAGLVVPSRIGNYTKIPLVKKMDNLSYEVILSAVNAETVVDLAYICCAGVVSIFILSTILSKYPLVSSTLVILILVILIGSIITMFNIHRFKSLRDKLVLISSGSGTWLIRKSADCLVKILELLNSTREIFSNSVTVAKLSSLTIITQLFGILGLIFIIKSVHTSLPFLDIFAILTVTYIVGIASLIPGGLGASDLSLIALLGYEGIPIPVATNIMVLWRVAMYLPVLIVVGMYFLQKKIKKEDIIFG